MSKRSASESTSSGKRMRSDPMFTKLFYEAEWKLPIDVPYTQIDAFVKAKPVNVSLDEWIESAFTVEGRNDFEEPVMDEWIESAFTVEGRNDFEEPVMDESIEESMPDEAFDEISDSFYGEKCLRESTPTAEPIDMPNQSGAGVQTGFRLGYEELRRYEPKKMRNLKKTKFLKGIAIKHNLKDFNGYFPEISEDMASMYEDLVNPVFELYSPEDTYGVTLNSCHLKSPIWIGRKQIKNFDRDEFLIEIEKVFQSNAELFLSGEFNIEVSIVETVTGSGMGRRKSYRAPETKTEHSKRKHSVITVKNTDNNCGYIAIWIGIQYFELNVSEWDLSVSANLKRWRSICALGGYSNKPQTIGAKDLCRNAGIDWNTPLSSTNFDNVQEFLSTKGFQLVVVDSGDKDNIVFHGPEEENRICIQWIDTKPLGHYNFIKDIKAYLEFSNFCKYCLKGYHGHKHKCAALCTACNEIESELTDCGICRKSFKNIECHQCHIMNCFATKTCNDCEIVFNAREKHECGVYKCHQCSEKHTGKHYCMMRPLDFDKLSKEDSKNKIIVTYDIESVQMAKGDSELYYHTPNLLIANVVCDKCYDYDNRRKAVDVCNECGIGYLQYFGEECVKRFATFLYEEIAPKAAKLKSYVYVFAHNSKGYDGHFLLKDLVEREYRDTEIVMTGLKLLKIENANVKFLDSLCFFQQSLASLPKSFGFDHLIEKGFFPHLFNTEENYPYVGPIPDLEYFGTKYMRPEVAKECEKWHSEFNGEYDFKEQLVKYCEIDVKILTMAVMEFRKLFIGVTGLDPFTRNFTLASTGLEYFRAVELKPNQLGVTPIRGYVQNRNKSRVANIWLDWSESQFGLIEREFKIGPHYADGFIASERHVFEFYGCYWHGCPTCWVESRSNRRNQAEEYEKVQQKEAYYARHDYRLTKVWEHEYQDLVKTTPELKTFKMQRNSYYHNIESVGHINVRDSFFGGRTNNLAFTRQCETESERIRYLDVTSLYPSVLVKNDYPLGHPIVVSEFESTEISQYFGFIKCKVLAPKDLYIPVLPYRSSKEKLLFPLCTLCAEEMSSECKHTDEQRCMTGTWFSEELKVAVEHGYVVQYIYEVLHYERKSDDVFKKYIQTWLKIKTEASGYPSNCQTEEKKQEFIKEFKAIEGVDLDVNKIKKNAGLRYIAKLMLNTLWGKLAQRPNQGSTTIVKDYNAYQKLITDDRVKITGEIDINDSTTLVSHKFIEDHFDRPGNTNIAIASMVTGYARIKLYSLISQIEASKRGRVLYFDTDSVIFADDVSKGWYVPEIGNFLGDMTDEVAQDYGLDAYMYKFASCGPKNYSYCIRLPNGDVKSKVKAKGIALTDENKDILKFDLVEEFAELYPLGVEKEIELNQLQFRIDRDHNVFTKDIKKKYRAVSDKRFFAPESLPEYQTLPYGYKY